MSWSVPLTDRVDVLNRYGSSDSVSQTLHVLKYIFPRQFGLHNVFTSVVDRYETSLPFKDYFTREEEIARDMKQRYCFSCGIGVLQN